MAGIAGTSAIIIRKDKELIRALHRLDEKVRKKVLRKAATKAARPIVKDAKKEAPVDTGALRQSLGVKIKYYVRSGSIAAIIGPRTSFKASKRVSERMTGAKARRRPAFYAHLVEFGTSQGARGVRFLTKAFERHKRGALAIMRAEAWSEIRKARAK